jgi:SAM-dependent methyltransferase
MYIKISDQLSLGVQEEMKAHEKGFSRQALDSSNSAKEYYLSGNSLSSHYYSKVLKLLPSKRELVILDVGVGNGQSSVFLAEQGVRCFAIEPDNNLCKLISEAAEKFSLPVTVCEGVGEDIVNIRKDNYFDAVIFNASLHHCDAPDEALRQAYTALRPGGWVFLLNESFLRPWVTETGYQRKLLADPIGMGHYGGNEHAYHNWKYEKMLSEAGFKSISRLPLQPLDVLGRIEYLLQLKIDGQRVCGKVSGIAARLLSYKLEEKIGSIYSLFQIISGLSLISCAFSSQKELSLGPMLGKTN